MVYSGISRAVAGTLTDLLIPLQLMAAIFAMMDAALAQFIKEARWTREATGVMCRR